MLQAAKDIDSHIAAYPLPVQDRLNKIRNFIKSEIPEATEAIKYAIPTFILSNQNFIHFAGYDKHIGIYPGSEAMIKFQEELSAYKTGKGSFQIPHNAPLPLPLIKKIIDYGKEIIKTKR